MIVNMFGVNGMFFGVESILIKLFMCLTAGNGSHMKKSFNIL